MQLMESGEMYLETVLVLSGTRENVRSVDIAEYMGFSKPSVSRAVSKLREDGYLSVDKDGFVSLTRTGHQVAQKIYERHTLLTKFLVGMGVPPEIAAADACKIEHDISDETFNAIKAHAKGGSHAG